VPLFEPARQALPVGAVERVVVIFVLVAPDVTVSTSLPQVLFDARFLASPE